jgi:hypothetical protein
MSEVYREGPWEVRDYGPTYTRRLMRCPLCDYEFDKGEERVEHFREEHGPEDLVVPEEVVDE